MDSEYLTRAGLRLLVGRVPRRELDRYVAQHQPPTPPLKAFTAWGEVTEWLPDHTDAAYLSQYRTWELRMIDQELALIAEAVTPIDAPDYVVLDGWRIADGALTGNDWWDWLRLVALADDTDRHNVVSLVWYHSTVTERGITEAAALFGVTWNGKPISPYRAGSSKAQALPAFSHRRITRALGYEWGAFCALDGPAQSEHVCFFMLDAKLSSRME